MLFSPWALTIAFLALIGCVLEILAAPFFALWLLVAAAI
jgi:hypothetical protein